MLLANGNREGSCIINCRLIVGIFSLIIIVLVIPGCRHGGGVGSLLPRHRDIGHRQRLVGQRYRCLLSSFLLVFDDQIVGHFSGVI